jgi:transcriptional regulator with XRE-family HTH domain
MTLSEKVAAEIRAEMGRQRQSAIGMEARLGWPRTYLGRRLRGEVSFNLDDIEAIAGALEVPVTAFFDFPAIDGGGVGGRVRSGRGIDHSVT